MVGPLIRAVPDNFGSMILILSDRPIKTTERFEVLDMSGRPLLSAQGNGSAQYRIGPVSFANGLYIVRLVAGDAVMATTTVLLMPPAAND